MLDYKALYLTMMRATEKATRILIEAQRDCEEQYLSAEEEAPALYLLPEDETPQ